MAQMAQGYVNLTDQLNDVREELEEKIDEQATSTKWWEILFLSNS